MYGEVFIDTARPLADAQEEPHPLCHVYGKVFIDTAQPLADAQEEPHPLCHVYGEVFIDTARPLADAQKEPHWAAHCDNYARYGLCQELYTLRPPLSGTEGRMS